MKKTVSVILAMLMFLPVFLGGCGDKESATTTAGETTAELVSTDKTMPQLPAEGFNGANYTVLVTGNFLCNDYLATEITQDVINDARYKRNVQVQDLLDIVIEVEENIAFGSDNGGGTGFQKLQQAYLTADYTYTSASVGTYDVSALAKNGLLTDLKTLPYVDLSMSWWDQRAIETLQVYNKLFFTTGDISIVDNIVTQCIIFNKNLKTELGITEDLYTLARERKWTIDVLTGIVRRVSGDLDGNDIYDQNDLYGLMYWNDATLASLAASGAKIASVQSDGSIKLTLNTPVAENAISKYCELVFDKQHTFNYQSLTSEQWDVERTRMFDNNQVLFYMSNFNVVPKHRDSMTDFGILPFPIFTEGQEDYENLVTASSAQFVCVPKLIESEELTGAVLEAMAYHSQQLVTPAYYEKTLKGRDIRDEESGEMLDIIFATHSYDLGLYYQIGSYNANLVTMVRAGINRFASIYQSTARQAESVITQLNEQYSAID